MSMFFVEQKKKPVSFTGWLSCDVCAHFTLERQQQTHNPKCVQEVLVLTDGRLRGGSKKKKKRKVADGSAAGEKWNKGTRMNGRLMCKKEKKTDVPLALNFYFYFF